MTHLEKGDKAPEFTSKDQNGKEISLSDYKGKKVALYFYPKDMTPGCTNQACNLRDNYAALEKEGIVILGVSPDDETRHQKFIDKHELPFPLIADTEKKVIQDYGIWGLKKFMGKEYDGLHRTTFLINEEGKIHDIIKKPKTKAHAEEIIEKFNQ
ncbi:thioredoxin-dependent thiol peroxidase [Brumimicrobium aurantiacum]|uniref:thioredoxin-dependent peroxiredoxin n=1 Tax=Brumimicrobium aurantiacum TaxID=1737063 RepID=A0A3E1F1Z9_9FLAO|nr:thioredoxin-dependent thiol peroxidase [Brumimicrobium aurantiacum]RFC55844.1 thioredoxin-dependent thiol peroxidase [Brumimicrobium aurantiacum]